MLDSKTYVHLTWKGSINNDDMKDATNELQILVLVLDAAHMVSRGAQCWPFRCLCVGVILYIYHHHHFAFSTLVAGGNKSHVCREPQSVCYPIFVFAQPLCLSLHWNIEH